MSTTYSLKQISDFLPNKMFGNKFYEARQHALIQPPEINFSVCGQASPNRGKMINHG